MPQRKYFHFDPQAVPRKAQFYQFVIDEFAKKTPHTVEDIRPIAKHFQRVVFSFYDDGIREGVIGWYPWRDRAKACAAGLYLTVVRDMLIASLTSTLGRANRQLMFNLDSCIEGMVPILTDMYRSGLHMQQTTEEAGKLILGVDDAIRQMIRDNLLDKASIGRVIMKLMREKVDETLDQQSKTVH